MTFEITNRWSGNVQFTAEIACDAGSSAAVKIGLAVKWARTNNAVLRDADLRDADLSGADLSGADLSGAVLRDADLRDADLRGAVLSGADLSRADLRDAVLSGAVLSRADLRDADLSGAVLSGADLSDAVLSGADLSGAVLSGADLSGAVLSGADLSGAVLSRADLSGAVLRDAVLRRADLRDAVLSGGLDGVPKIPSIHTALHTAASVDGALNMGSWHCGTTHCRAGWVVTLAGDAGRALELAIGTPAAAAFIYMASDPKLERVPDFYTSNKAALADMKRLADAEAAATDATA